MGYFAHVSETVVTDVHVLADGVTDDLPFPESEPLGQAFLSDLWGDTPESYVECSIDGEYRGCYPGVGYAYDPVLDVFVAPESPPIEEGPPSE
jgi:hypothetical protein